MAIQTLNTIKSWFRKGLYPTEGQFSDTWDSFWHKDDKIPIPQIDRLAQELNGKADSNVINNIISIITDIENNLDNPRASLPVLSIHAPANSCNILDALQLTGIAINRNCNAIAIVDKEDDNNFLRLDLFEGTEMEMIDFSQFSGKSVYILAAGSDNNGNETDDLDLTLTFKYEYKNGIQTNNSNGGGKRQSFFAREKRQFFERI